MAKIDDNNLERFAVNVFSGMTQRDAYLDAFPRSRKLKTATVDVRASELMSYNDDVKARIEELKDEAADEVIMKVRERMITLSEIARDEEVSVKMRISAIDVLNRMDGTYIRAGAKTEEAQGVTIINDTQ